MTACSNHPGTIAGSDLKELLAANSELAALLEPQLITIATGLGMTLAQLDLLLTIEAGEAVDRHSADAVALSARLGFTNETADRLTRKGVLALAEFGSQQAALLDLVATGIDAAALRAGQVGREELLRRLAEIA